MTDDFPEKNAALEAIEDPHAKDLANYSYTLAKSARRLGTIGVISSGCFLTCASLLETGDHALGLLCYSGCTIVAGSIAYIGAKNVAAAPSLSYRNFRKTWQKFSIPVKDFLMNYIP